MKSVRLFKYPADVTHNLAALSLLLSFYLGGWWLLFSSLAGLNLIGILLLAESMVLAAFFVHEFAHGSIFQLGSWNRIAGKLCIWLTFHGFFSFTRIQQLHIAHHRNHADVIHFDFHAHLAQHSAQQKLLMRLEYCYIPAVELLIKWHSIRRLWQTQIGADRQLILAALAIYSCVFIGLLTLQPRALGGFLLAYMLLLHVLRFMDMHQHTYSAHILDAQGNIPVLPVHDKTYEQANTYSNVFAPAYTWLNLLTLNFGYHNAHHAKPFIPWCRLPQLHQSLTYEKHELPMSSLLQNYHQFRVQRVANPHMGMPKMTALPRLRAANFPGVIGASFLNA